MPKLLSSPCYNCTKRKLGCHDRCADYADYHQAREEVLEKKHEYTRRYILSEKADKALLRRQK